MPNRRLRIHSFELKNIPFPMTFSINVIDEPIIRVRVRVRVRVTGRSHTSASSRSLYPIAMGS